MASHDSAVFTLDPAFEATSRPLRRLPLCEARLQLDARWSWIVLVPALPGLVEVEDLSPADRGRLIEEIVLAGAAVRAMGAALGRPVEKLNIGALGNITRQLHAHVVGRRGDDPAWSGPVWGHGAAIRPAEADVRLATAAAMAVLAPSPASP